MGNSNGGKKPDVNESLDRQRKMIATLKERREELVAKIETERSAAEQFLAEGKEDAAQECTTRKEEFEEKVAKLDAQVTNLTDMNEKLVEAQRQAAEMEAKQAVAAQMRAGGPVPIDDCDAVEE